MENNGNVKLAPCFFGRFLRFLRNLIVNFTKSWFFVDFLTTKLPIFPIFLLNFCVFFDMLFVKNTIFCRIFAAF